MLNFIRKHHTRLDLWYTNYISSSVLTYGCRESSGGGVGQGWRVAISWDLTFSSGVSTFLHSMLTFESQKSWWQISRHETGCNDSYCKTALCRVSKSTNSCCNSHRPPSAGVAVSADWPSCPPSLTYSRGEYITVPGNTLSFLEHSVS